MAHEKSIEVGVIEVADNEQKQMQQHAVRSSSQAASKGFLSGWIIEVLSLLAAIASLAVITGILIALDHENVSQLPFKINLNTAISILSKITEATIALILAACLSQIMWMRYSSRPRPINDFAVYDAASRGVKGQAMFLLQRHQGVKGYVGVTLALMTLAIGPFYQEMVDYQTVNGLATLPRCYSTNYSTSSDAMYNALHGSLYDDINQVGTRRDQTLQSLNNDCITGNCTWPIYASIGICGGCTNISEQVVTNCTMRQDTIKGLVYGCISSLNDHTFINNYTDPDMGQILASMSPNVDLAAEQRYGHSLNYDFSSIRYAKSGVVHAASCQVYYCVRGYNSSVTDTALGENFTSIWFDSNAAKVSGAVIPDFSTGKPTGPENDTVLSPPQSEWVKLNITKPTNFTIDWYTHKMLNQHLTTAFNGTYYVNYTNSSESSKYIGRTGNDVVVSQIFTNLWAADPTQQNLRTILTAYAIEMTNGLRKTCPTADFVPGVAKSVAILLDVAWLWLIFPALLIICTGGLLFATMIESRQRRSVLWKTGILPLLFHGIVAHPDPSVNGGPKAAQEVPAQLAAELEHLEGMEKHVQGMRVRLERNESGVWHFSRPKDD